MNTPFPLVTSRPLIAPSFFSAAPASPSSATVRASNLLIGSPWRSKRSSAKPFASLSTWMDCPWYRGVLDITNTSLTDGKCDAHDGERLLRDGKFEGGHHSRGPVIAKPRS